MSGFIGLPSGRVINAAHIFIIGLEVDLYEGARFGDSRQKLGRYLTTASATGQPPDDTLGRQWLDKADADALIAVLLPTDWTTQ